MFQNLLFVFWGCFAANCWARVQIHWWVMRDLASRWFAFFKNGLWFSHVCSCWILLKITFGMFDYGKWNASLPEALKLKKEAKTGFVYIVILIMRNWRQCIGIAMYWYLFIFSSFSMRVFIRITCFFWWNISFMLLSQQNFYFKRSCGFEHKLSDVKSYKMWA